ncbi:hypothetical protein HN937_08760 [Candidatus Poribacteria bacterium]|nr:hypothetical protein [Candidatus Poribacteria bacterium]
MARVNITEAIVDHLVERLQSLTLDDPTIAVQLSHDPDRKADTDTKALDTDFRRFSWAFPTKATPAPLHVGSAEYHPRLWRLPLGLEITYPWGSPENRLIVAGMAIDDQHRIIHHLEADFTRQSDPTLYQWTGVEVDALDLTASADHYVAPYTVTAIYQRLFPTS